MYISRKSTRPARRRVTAGEEIEKEYIEKEYVDEDREYEEEYEDVVVDPSATELVFETEDVAQLIAEVTGETVEVEADEDEVVFTVGDADYTVEPEGDEEILETSKKALKGKKTVDSACGSRKRKAVKSARRMGRRARK